jgi:hypothetical protein
MPTKKTPYQRDLARIWAGAKTLGIDKDTLHDLLFNLTGKDSLTRTTKSDRWKLIQELSAKGAYRYRPRKPAPEAPARKGTDIISADQQKKIDELWENLVELGVGNAGSKRWRAAFCQRIIGKPWPQKVWEAQKVIEALKKRVDQTSRAARD